MKYVLPVILAVLILGCNKDKVPEINNDEASYYQSNGNLLILLIDGDFNRAYEYNLASTELTNDSLRIQVDSESGGLSFKTYWRYLPNPDTLFWQSDNKTTFNEFSIVTSSLEKLSTTVPLDTNLFQKIVIQEDVDYSEIWSEISNLSIVKTYRDALPQSKIGITREIIYELDEDLGFSVPKEVFIVVLVK
jgi:hypothetical protein